VQKSRDFVITKLELASQLFWSYQHDVKELLKLETIRNLDIQKFFGKHCLGVLNFPFFTFMVANKLCFESPRAKLPF